MAIQPPSDIVLEVSKAADPERLKVAAAKLQKLGESTGTAFAQVIEKMVPPSPSPDMAAPASASAPIPRPFGPSLPFDVAKARLDMRNDTSRLQTAADVQSATRADRTKALQEFEAMVLQTFIASMLPQDAETVYGEGTAGSFWKSMLAEQIGKQMAKSGGIGIVDRILANNPTMEAAGKPGAALAAGIGKRPDMSGLSPSSLSALLSSPARI